METEKARKALKILNEYDDLQRYRIMFNSDKGDSAHFELVQNYNIELTKNQKVRIPRKYNQRFVDLLNKIIDELSSKLNKL